MTDEKEEYKIVEDDAPKMQFKGNGFKVVVKSVTATATNVDPERDVTQFFKDSDGKCLICELRCSKDDCTECKVPGYSERITSQVMGNITSHKAPPMMKMERFQRR